jgi:type II secretory pathway pseudopilin PulG
VKKLAGFFRDQKGVTYLMALMIVMITGIMLGSVGQTWKTLMQREKEEELLFRGQQIADALTRWHSPRAGQTPATPLTDLKDLLKDPRTPVTVKYLRKLYTDPITNSEWVLVKDPTRGIVGVASSSTQATLKKDNFPDELKEFAGKQRYNEWVFSYRQGAAPVVAQPGGLPTMPQPK